MSGSNDISSSAAVNVSMDAITKMLETLKKRDAIDANAAAAISAAAAAIASNGSNGTTKSKKSKPKQPAVAAAAAAAAAAPAAVAVDANKEEKKAPSLAPPRISELDRSKLRLYILTVRRGLHLMSLDESHYPEVMKTGMSLTLANRTISVLCFFHRHSPVFCIRYTDFKEIFSAWDNGGTPARYIDAWEGKALSDSQLKQACHAISQCTANLKKVAAAKSYSDLADIRTVITGHFNDGEEVRRLDNGLVCVSTVHALLNTAIKLHKESKGGGEITHMTIQGSLCVPKSDKKPQKADVFEFAYGVSVVLEIQGRFFDVVSSCALPGASLSAEKRYSAPQIIKDETFQFMLAPNHSDNLSACKKHFDARIAGRQMKIDAKKQKKAAKGGGGGAGGDDEDDDNDQAVVAAAAAAASAASVAVEDEPDADVDMKDAKPAKPEKAEPAKKPKKKSLKRAREPDVPAAATAAAVATEAKAEVSAKPKPKSKSKPAAISAADELEMHARNGHDHGQDKPDGKKAEKDDADGDEPMDAVDASGDDTASELGNDNDDANKSDPDIAYTQDPGSDVESPRDPEPEKEEEVKARVKRRRLKQYDADSDVPSTPPPTVPAPAPAPVPVAAPLPPPPAPAAAPTPAPVKGVKSHSIPAEILGSPASQRSEPVAAPAAGVKSTPAQAPVAAVAAAKEVVVVDEASAPMEIDLDGMC